MTSVQQQPISNSSYAYRSVRYYCTTCQRPFSELNTGDSATSQARCPRCNLWAFPASAQNTTQNTQSNRNNNTSNQPRTSRPQAASASRPQVNQANPFGFFSQQTGNFFDNGFFGGFGVPVGSQNQGRSRGNNQYNNNPQYRNNNNGQYGDLGGDMFTQVFGNFGNMFGNAAAVPQNFGFADGFGGYSDVFNGFNGFNQQENGVYGGNVGNMGNVYNDFGPYMADDATIEEFLRDDPNEHGPPPASEKAMNRLKEVKFDPTRKEEGSENMCCPVCQEDYREGETLVRLPCQHDYHRQCVETWLNKHNSCPMCRNPI